jgi:hypothetical protein
MQNDQHQFTKIPSSKCPTALKNQILKNLPGRSSALQWLPAVLTFVTNGNG